MEMGRGMVMCKKWHSFWTVSCPVVVVIFALLNH